MSSYLDELTRLFDHAGKDGSVEAEPVTVRDEAIQKVREQLDSSRRGYFEAEPGVWRFCGTRTGCGYAEGVVRVDEEGIATVEIDCNARVSAGNVKPMRKIFHSINSSLIVAGFRVADDGRVTFVTDCPVDVNTEDEDIDVVAGRALSSIHEYTWMLAAIEAGVEPYELLYHDSKIPVRGDSSDSGDSGDGGADNDPLEALRALFS